MRVAAVTGMIAIGALNVPSVWAQAPAGAAPTFEVATIKPHKGGNGGGGFAGEHGRLTITGVSLKLLIQDAYGVMDFQISGGPDWIDLETFDVVGKAENDASSEELWKMVQPLLADRFKLKFHRATKEGPVYDLTIAKSGLKLHKSAEDAQHQGMMRRSGRRGQQYTAQQMTMPALPMILSSSVTRPVIDKTGLEGGYDLKLEWTQDTGVTADSSGAPLIFTAVEEQLGLKLESAKGPIEMLVVESAEKPSDN
jgi:uncharacterized protein (TIGR03435 family)